MSSHRQFVLTLSCRDTQGIVRAVSGLLCRADCNILASQPFGDVQNGDSTGLFFMRVHFEAPKERAASSAIDALFAGAVSNHNDFEALAVGYGRAFHHLALPTGSSAAAKREQEQFIEQDVERVDHSLSPEDFTAVGRDVECVAPARAVRWHVEHRVLMNGHKTEAFH